LRYFCPLGRRERGERGRGEERLVIQRQDSFTLAELLRARKALKQNKKDKMFCTIFLKNKKFTCESQLTLLPFTNGSPLELKITFNSFLFDNCCYKEGNLTVLQNVNRCFRSPKATSLSIAKASKSNHDQECQI
jgi:hypothetical protein